MTVESDWRPGTSVTMTLGDQARLTGDILVAERPRRLSYTLGDRPGQPSVYVNWELRALGDATIVRLYVDEPWPDADPTDDLEAAWLPVLYDLVAYLDWGAGRFPSDRDLPDPSWLGAVLGLGLLGTAGKQRGPCHGHRGVGSRPDPASRGAPPMSTGTITARPAVGAGPAKAPRTAFVLAAAPPSGQCRPGWCMPCTSAASPPDLLAGTSAGALNAAFPASRPHRRWPTPPNWRPSAAGCGATTSSRSARAWSGSGDYTVGD